MRKGELTRSAILEQAIRLASKVGLSGLTIGRLADELDMSKSGLFAHFGSKEELEVQVLDAAASEFVTHVISPGLKAPRGEPRLRALIERWLAWDKRPEQPGGCIFVAAAVELDDRPGPARDRLVALQRDRHEAFATAVRIAIAEGHLRADVDPDQVAFEIFAIALAYHHHSRLLHDERAEKRAWTAFERLLRDAKPQPGT